MSIDYNTKPVVAFIKDLILGTERGLLSWEVGKTDAGAHKYTLKGADPIVCYVLAMGKGGNRDSAYLIIGSDEVSLPFGEGFYLRGLPEAIKTREVFLNIGSLLKSNPGIGENFTGLYPHVLAKAGADESGEVEL